MYHPSMPAKVWHFAELALATLPDSGGIVRNTLGMRAQAVLEQALREQLTSIDGAASAGPVTQAPGGLTASGVLVDNTTGAVIAYVGNIRFDPARGHHWVDCALAPRSPGPP